MPATAKKLRTGRKKIAELKIVTDPAEAAEEAGLRYVSDAQPGYTRKARADGGFDYFDTAGKPIRDEPRLLRIKRLAVPPAWTDVWICPSAHGHLQAVGYDARRRKQYRYHERWRQVRDENKYGRMAVFGAAVPKIRRRVDQDLARSGLPKEKVLATVVQLLERTFIRVGNEEYKKANQSFGLTTMQDRHVDIKGSRLRFSFKGKSGVPHQVDLSDRRIARIVGKLQDLPGQDLIQYVNDDGQVVDIVSQDVNQYLKQISGEDFTAKDFRTWAGTVLTAMALSQLGGFSTQKQGKANVKTAITAVSKLLGNTPAVCRKCYIHPAVLETYLNGEIIPGLPRQTGATLDNGALDLHEGEAAILKFLQARMVQEGR